MGRDFDPYYLWLGIPPQEQPADYYRLLGIARFESDPDVIERAADRQIEFVRQQLTTPQGEAARRLLQELNHARNVLLDPTKKSAYDAELATHFTPSREEKLDWLSGQAPSSTSSRRVRKRGATAPFLFLWHHPGVTLCIALILLVTSALVNRWIPPAPSTPVPETGSSEGAASAATASSAKPDDSRGVSGVMPPNLEHPAASVPTGGRSEGTASVSAPQGTFVPGIPRGASEFPASGTREGPAQAQGVTQIQPQLVPLRPGLIGRITVKGEDLGVIVRYTPAEAVTREVLERLVVQYGLQPGDETLRLRGVIRVNAPSKVGVPIHIQIIWENAPWKDVQISVDGNNLTIPADFGEGTWNTALVLTGGDHSLECQLRGRPWANTFKLAVTSVGGEPGPIVSEGLAQSRSPSIEVGYTEALLAEVSQFPTLGRHSLNSELAALTAEELSLAMHEKPETDGSPAGSATTAAKMPQRLPIPLASEEKQARDSIRQEFRKDLQEATAPAAKVLLARMLLKQGNQETDPVRRFVFYKEARELALSGGDFDLAIQVGEALGLTFEIDPWALHIEAAETLVRNARSAEAREKLLAGLELLANSAIEEDRYPEADSFLDLGVNLASQLRDSFRREQLARKKDDAKAVAAAYNAVRDHLETLETSPDDPAANEAVGRFYCFLKQDWKKGLPYLAKAETALLRAVAEADLLSPVQPSTQLQLGDDWWAVAETLPEREKNAVRRRAGFWYLRCETRVTGEGAQRVSARLGECGRLVNLLALAAARRVTLQGNWQLGVKAIISSPEPFTQIIFPVIPPEEYDVVIDIQPLPPPPPPRGTSQTQRPNPILDTGRGAFAVALVQGRHSFLAVVDWSLPNLGTYCFLANCNGRGPEPANPTFQQVQAIRAQRPNTLVYSVRKGSVTVMANGVPVINYSGDFSALTMPQGWGTQTASRLFFATRSATYQITRAELRDLGP